MDNNFNNGYFNGYPDNNGYDNNYPDNNSYDNNYQDNSGYDNTYPDNNGYDGYYPDSNGYDSNYPDNNSYDDSYQDSNGYDSNYPDNNYQDNGEWYGDYQEEGWYDNNQYDNNQYDNNQYNKPKKTKTGVIVGLTLLFLVTIAAVTILIVVLVKNGKEKDENENQGTAVAVTSNTTTAMTTEMTTTTTSTDTTSETETEATTETVSSIPFSEEKGFTYNNPNLGLILPLHCYAKDTNGNRISDDIAKGLQTNAQFTFDEISKSAPNENGYVTITIKYTVKTTDDFLLKSGSTWDNSWSIWDSTYLFDLCDSYTGSVLRWSGKDATSGADLDIVYTTVTYNGQSYEIGLTDDLQRVDYGKDLAFIAAREDGDLYRMNRDWIHTITVYAPAQYDGLLLFNYKEPFAASWENTTSNPDENIIYNVLGPDSRGLSYTPDQLVFIKVNDYIN